VRGWAIIPQFAAIIPQLATIISIDWLHLHFIDFIVNFIGPDYRTSRRTPNQSLSLIHWSQLLLIECIPSLSFINATVADLLMPLIDLAGIYDWYDFC
jgi:hypothetical protein